MIPIYPYPQFPQQKTRQIFGDGSLSDHLYYMLLALFKRTGGPGGIPLTVGERLVAAGTNQATATALTDDYNEVLSGTGGVVLNALQQGQSQTVFNGTGSAINVYPALGGSIDSLATNAPYSLAAKFTQVFTAYEVSNGATLYRPLSSLSLTPVPLPLAATQSQPSDPAAPASTANFTMQGLAGTITPTLTGRVLLTITGTVIDATAATAGIGITWQLSQGTGVAPIAGAALTGTQLADVQTYELAVGSTAADVQQPFSISSIITGLTLGTAIWLDLAAKAIGTANRMSFQNVTVIAIEF